MFQSNAQPGCAHFITFHSLNVHKPQKQSETVFEYKLKRCSQEECCKQRWHVKVKGNLKKWPVQNQTHGTAQKHAKHQDATDI